MNDWGERKVDSNITPEKIISGRICHADVAFVEKHGTRQQKQALVKASNNAFRERKDLDRVHGKGKFHYRDNKGNLVKDVPLSGIL